MCPKSQGVQGNKKAERFFTLFFAHSQGTQSEPIDVQPSNAQDSNIETCDEQPAVNGLATPMPIVENPRFPSLAGHPMKAAALHILVKSRPECDALKKQLVKGAHFGELARRHSLCPSGKRGGDLGEFRQGQMVKAFDDAVFKGALLTVQGPIKTQFGYHLIKVLYRS